jgi:hypothetical protein
MLKGIALASGVLLSGFERLGWPAMASATAAVQQGSSGGRQLGLVEFTGEPRIEMDTVNGAELNCRLFTDLSTLTPRKSDHPDQKLLHSYRSLEAPGRQQAMDHPARRPGGKTGDDHPETYGNFSQARRHAPDGVRRQFSDRAVRPNERGRMGRSSDGPSAGVRKSACARETHFGFRFRPLRIRVGSRYRAQAGSSPAGNLSPPARSWRK